MTKTQLQNQIKKISRELEQYDWRIEGLKKLKEFQEHEMIGLQKGFDEDIEYGVKISSKRAKEKGEKRIKSIERKIAGCLQIQDAIRKRLELTKEDISICTMPSIKRYD